MNYENIIKNIRTLLRNKGKYENIKSYMEAEIDIISDDIAKDSSSVTNHYDELDRAFNAYPLYSKEQEDAVVKAVFLILTENFYFKGATNIISN